METKTQKEFDTFTTSIETKLGDVSDKGKYEKKISASKNQRSIDSLKKDLQSFYNGVIADVAKLVIFDASVNKISNPKDKLKYKKMCLTAAKQNVATLQAIKDTTIKALLSLTDAILDAEITKSTTLRNALQANIDALEAEIAAAKQQQVAAAVQAADAAAAAQDATDDDDDDEPIHAPTDMTDQLAELGLVPSFGSGSLSSIKEKLKIHLSSMKTPKLKTKLEINFGDQEVLGTRITQAETILATFADRGGLVKHMRKDLLPKRPNLDSFESKINNKVNPDKDAINDFRIACLKFVNDNFRVHLKFLQENYETFKKSGLHLSAVRTFFQEFQTRGLNGFSLNFLEEIENTLPNLQSFFVFLTDDEFADERDRTGCVSFHPVKAVEPFDGVYSATLFGKEITIRQANDELMKLNPKFNDLKKMFLAYPKRQSDAIKDKSTYSLAKVCNKDFTNVNGVTVHTYIGPDDDGRPDGCVVTDAYNGHPLSLSKKRKKLLTVLGPPVYPDNNLYLEVRNRLNQEHINEVAAIIVSLFFSRGRLSGRARAGRARAGAGGAGGAVALLTGAEKFNHYIVLLMHNLQMITEKANQAVNSEHFSSILGKLAYMIYDFLIHPGSTDASFEKRFAIILGKLLAMEEIAITDDHSGLLEQNIENLRNIREGITNLAQFVFFSPEGDYFPPVDVRPGRPGRPPQSAAFKKLEKDYHDLCQVSDAQTAVIAGLSAIVALHKAELVAARAAAPPVPAVAAAAAPVVPAAAAAATADGSDGSLANAAAAVVAAPVPAVPAPAVAAAVKRAAAATANMKRTRDAAETLAKDARDKLASAAEDAAETLAKDARDKLASVAGPPGAARSARPKKPAPGAAQSATPAAAPAAQLNAGGFREALSTLGRGEPSPIKTFTDELLLIADKNFLVAKDKYLVALDLAAAAASVAAEAAAAAADNEVDDAVAAARSIADELNSITTEARNAESTSKPRDVKGRFAAPAVAAAAAAPAAAARRELVILQLASLYSTYHSYFKDFCRKLAMIDNASLNEDELRVANPPLATELLTLQFPPDIKTTSLLHGLITRYKLEVVFRQFKVKVNNLKVLIEVIRETDGFSELIRKARTLMKSRDNASMTELINAVQVLTESDQYDSNDDVVVLAERVADAEGDYLDVVGKFLGLPDASQVKKDKYRAVLAIDGLELGQAVAQAQGAAAAETKEESDAQETIKGPPVTPKAAPPQTQTPNLTELLAASTPHSMLDGYNNLLILEAEEFGVELTAELSTPFTPVNFTSDAPHPTIVKLKAAQRTAVDAEIAEEERTTAPQTTESAICSGTFERTYAVRNLQKKLHIKRSFNVDAFYDEAPKAVIVLPIFAGSVRGDETPDAYLTRQLIEKMGPLPDVSTMFPNTLNPPVGITTRVSAAFKSVVSAVSNLFKPQQANAPKDGRRISYSQDLAAPTSPGTRIGGAPPMTSQDPVNQLYDFYIYFLENDIEDETREKIKDILFYHGIYCPSEQKDAIDLNVLVEEVKRSDENDDFKCEKCCHTVFGMGFHELFYSLSNGLPAIPFGCHPYLLDDPMNRNTFLYIFGVSRYLHVAFPKSARMELYFMTLCSTFGRDYWICKRPDYDIQADVINPMFFTTFYELSGDPEYYEVNLTPDAFLESNGKKFAARKRNKMVEIMKDIETRKAEIEEKVKQNRFKEAQSNLKELTRNVEKEIRRAKRTQEKATLAGIDLEQEIEFMNEDSEEVTRSKKQVHCFKLFLLETISRKNKAIEKFIDNAKTMKECAPDETAIENIKEIMSSIPELSDYLPKEVQASVQYQNKLDFTEILDDELAQRTKDLFGVTVSEFEQKVGVSPKELDGKNRQLATVSRELNINTGNFNERAQELKSVLSPKPLAEPSSINFETGPGTLIPTGGKTLRKRAVYNKTRTKLNRKSRRNRYK